MINKLKLKLKKLSPAIVSIIAIVLFTIPTFAAPYSFTYTFKEVDTIVYTCKYEKGKYVPINYMLMRESDNSFYNNNLSAFSYMYFNMNDNLPFSLSVTQGQVLKSDATGNPDDNSSAFRLYCEGTQGQSFVSKATSVRFLLLDASENVLGSVTSSLQKINANYLYAPVPEIKVSAAGVAAYIACVIELSSSFSGSLRIFYAGRTWNFTLGTPGDPANPDYSSPDTSTLDEYESAESNVMNKINGGLSDSKSLFQSFSNNVAPFIQGTMFMSSVIGKIISGNSNINNLLMISLSLGVFGLITNILAQVLTKPRDNTPKHRKRRDK